MPINLTNVTAATNLGAQAQAWDQLTDGLFGILFLVTAMVIIFLSLRIRTTTDDIVLFSFTLWFGFILSVMMRALDLLPASVVIIVTIFSIGTIGFLVIVKR